MDWIYGGAPVGHLDCRWVLCVCARATLKGGGSKQPLSCGTVLNDGDLY